MWDGIYIKDATAVLNINQMLASQSTIQDAKNAIVSQNGGKFYLNKTYFDLDYKDIVVKDYSFAHNSFISKSNFTCSGSILHQLPPVTATRTVIGIDISNIGDLYSSAGITIGDITSNSNTNNFSKMDVGIKAYHSNVNIYNNSFSNISTVPGTGIAKSAIWAIGTPLFPLSVKSKIIIGGTGNNKNTFTNCINGVYAENNINLTVANNNFSNITINGIYFTNFYKTNTVLVSSNSFTDARTAIYGYRNIRCTSNIQLNDITFSQSFLSGTGILLQEFSNLNPNAKYTVYNNTITRAVKGIGCSNLNAANIDNNTIKVKTTSFSFLPSRGIEALGCFDTYITNNRISPNISTSNDWVGGVYASLSEQSHIICNDVKNIGYAYKCNGPMQPSWLYNNSMTNCKTGIWLDNQALIGTQGSSSWPNYNKWYGSFANGTFSSGSTLGNLSPFYYRSTPIFYNSPSNHFDIASGATQIPFNPTNAGPTIVLCTWVAGPKIPISILVATNQINFIDNIPNARWLSKHALYNEMIYDKTMADSSIILKQFKDSTELSATGILDSINNLICSYYNSSDTNSFVLQNANNLNNSVAPLYTTENRYKKINEIVISSLLSGSSYFTQEQLDTLRVIANECPYISGKAVYQARVLLAQYDSIGTIYSNPCEYEITNSNSKIIPEFSNPEAEIYPNPAQNYITVFFNMGDDKPAVIEFYDVLGNKVASFNIVQGENSINIDDRNFDSGVYFYKITNGDTIIDSDKLVIIK